MKIKRKAANEKFTPKSFEVEWTKFMLDIRQVQKGIENEKIKNANTRQLNRKSLDQIFIRYKYDVKILSDGIKSLPYENMVFFCV